MAFSFILNKMVNSIMVRKYHCNIDLLGAFLFVGLLPNKTHNSSDTNTEHKKDYRAAYHFTTPDKWKNDPQKPIFRGKYHYYYLYNRDYPNGNGTEWRHAVSEDLVHWTDEGTAIPKYTNENGDIWSGSVVIDKHNTAGFGKTRWSPSQRSRLPKQKPRNNIYGTARIRENVYFL